MNCAKCRSDINVKAAWFVEPPQTNAMVFCDEACVRAWLGPDRPLSRRVEDAENRSLSPQHIVVDPLKRVAELLIKNCSAETPAAMVAVFLKA